MSVRPPKAFAPKSQATPFEEALDHEIRGEMAGTHGRLLQVLEKRLAALAAFDARTPDAAPAERDPLVAAAGEALRPAAIRLPIVVAFSSFSCLRLQRFLGGTIYGESTVY